MPSAAENKDFIEQIIEQYPLDTAVDWIAKNMDPDDVFSESDLETWAENNGYVKEE